MWEFAFKVKGYGESMKGTFIQGLTKPSEWWDLAGQTFKEDVLLQGIYTAFEHDIFCATVSVLLLLQRILCTTSPRQ